MKIERKIRCGSHDITGGLPALESKNDLQYQERLDNSRRVKDFLLRLFKPFKNGHKQEGVNLYHMPEICLNAHLGIAKGLNRQTNRAEERGWSPILFWIFIENLDALQAAGFKVSVIFTREITRGRSQWLEWVEFPWELRDESKDIDWTERGSKYRCFLGFWEEHGPKYRRRVKNED